MAVTPGVVHHWGNLDGCQRRRRSINSIALLHTEMITAVSRRDFTVKGVLWREVGVGAMDGVGGGNLWSLVAVDE